MSNGCKKNDEIIVVGKILEVEVKVEVEEELELELELVLERKGKGKVKEKGKVKVKEKGKNKCKYIAKIKNINEVKFDLSDNIGKQKYYYLFRKSNNCDLCRTYIDVIKVYTYDERIFDVLKLAFEKGYIVEVGFCINNNTSNNNTSNNETSSDKDNNNNANNNTCNIKSHDYYEVLYVNLRKPQEEI